MHYPKVQLLRLIPWIVFEDKVGALQWALEYYNRTGIPAKTINIDVSPALQAIADLQQRLYNIPDEQVYINVQENRVYTATSPTGLTRSMGICNRY